MHGVLNLLKPPGMTSHDAVAFARRVLGIKRIGHMGTLDPAAAGVLPLCIGQATRLVEYIQGGSKDYIAEATFGYETDTCDAVGQVVAQGDASQLDVEKLRAAMDSFRGLIVQTPPIYSAVKKDGRKLYDLARAGWDEADVEIPTREVYIDRLIATRFSLEGNTARAMLSVGCSSGTYIRSLVRDIGRELGCYATMTFLVRARNGGFSIDSATPLEAIEARPSEHLIPMEEVLNGIASFSWINEEAAVALSQGRIYQSPVTWVQLSRAPSFPFQHKVAWLLSTVDADTNRFGVFWNESKTIAVLARRIAPLSHQQYKPEKVFFLDS